MIINCTKIVKVYMHISFEYTLKYTGQYNTVHNEGMWNCASLSFDRMSINP